MALKHVGFDAGENEIQIATKAMNGVDGGDIAADVTSTSSSSSSSVLARMDTDSSKSSHDSSVVDVPQTVQPQVGEDSAKEDEQQPSGLELDKEQLLNHRMSTLLWFSRGSLYV